MSWHGVDLGTSYNNNQACAGILEQDFTEQLAIVQNKAKFFSTQADGSTDAGRDFKPMLISD